MFSNPIINKLHKPIGIILALTFLLIGLNTISDYGITWDFMNHFYRGEAYLHFYLTGNSDYSDVPDDKKCKFQTVTFDELSNQQNAATHGETSEGSHPSLGGMFSALGCDIFHKYTNLLGVIDAHHVMFIVLASLAVLAFYLMVLDTFGFSVAFLATVLFALFPRFIGHAHNNFKDIPVLSFLILTCWAALKGVKFKSWKWLLLAGLFYGLSIATKLSGYYLPFVLLFWFIIVWQNDKPNFTFKENKVFWTALLSFPFIALIPFISLWPYLWQDLGHIFSKLRHIGKFYSSPMGEISRTAPWRPYYATGYAFITTPEVILFFGIIGFFYACKHWKEEKTKPYLFFATWFISAILAFTLVKVHLYNGIRQFISFAPPFCVLAAIGILKFIEFSKKKAARHIDESTAEMIAMMIVLAGILHLLVTVTQIHPFQTTYFNSLIGGLKGAKQVRIPLASNTVGLPGAKDYWGNEYRPDIRIGIPEATDYWGNSYRVAVRWLNKNIEQNSLLVVEYGKHLVEANGELRADVTLTGFEDIMKQNKYPGYLMSTDNKWVDKWNVPLQYCFANLKPYHILESQGAPIVLIYKLK